MKDARSDRIAFFIVVGDDASSCLENYQIDENENYTQGLIIERTHKHTVDLQQASASSKEASSR